MKRIIMAALVLLWSGSIVAQNKESTPIIIIMADQLRPDVLGKLTPNINSLKQDGVSFSRAYCAAPLCAPSRSSFFTGMYPNRTGSMINPWEKEDEIFGTTRAGIPNLYRMLEDKWDSRHVGKQHFFTAEKIDKDPKSKTTWTTQADYSAWMKQQRRSKPGGKKFKDTAPEIVSGSYTRLRSYSTPRVALYKEGKDVFLDHYLASESVAAIKNRDKSKPLLLNAMFLAPHPPFDIPDPYFSMLTPKDFLLPENVGQWYPGQSPLQMYNLTGFIGTRYNREQWGEIWAKYLGLVKLLDDEVGRVIAALKEEGLYDKAVIVFTADHGEMLGSHSLWQKMCMYDESAKVPLIIKFPQSVAPVVKESSTLVSLVDVFPTLLDVVGLSGAANMDGKSLLPLVKGKSLGREAVFVQYDGNGSLGSAQRCVLKGDYKLIVDMFKDETFLELYDMKKDPQEKNNLIFERSHEKVSDELISELIGYMTRTEDRLTLPKNMKALFLENHKNGLQQSEGAEN